MATTTTAEGAKILKALAKLTPAEAAVVWNALSQYVENGQCDDTTDDPYEADPSLKDAESALEKIEAAIVEGI